MSVPVRSDFDRGIVYLTSIIDNEIADEVIASLLVIDANFEKQERDRLARSPESDRPASVWLAIESPGGDVDACLAIYAAYGYIIENSGRTLCTVATGPTGGAATLLLAAGTPGHRAILAGTPITMSQSALSYDDKSRSPRWTASGGIDDRIAEYLSLHVGKDVRRVRQDITRSAVLRDADVVQAGLADRIITSFS